MTSPLFAMPVQKYTEERPWGMFEQFTHNQPSTVKILTINPHQSLSLQLHHQREEFWRVLSGQPIVTLGDRVFEATLGQEIDIAPEQQHRIEAKDDPVQILEIAFGDFAEDDEIRLEDKYHRND